MSDARFTVLDQLDQLEEIVLEGSRLPFTGGRLVNEGDAVEVLDAIREAMPKEVERAGQLLDRRDEFINTARQQAEEIVQQAQRQREQRHSGRGAGAPRLGTTKETVEGKNIGASEPPSGGRFFFFFLFLFVFLFLLFLFDFWVLVSFCVF